MNNKVSSLSNLLHQQVEDMKSGKQAENPIWTRYSALDRRINGFCLGEFVVVGGRPAMGKTQLLINLALNISKNHPVLFITNEDSEQLITQRFLSSISDIPRYILRMGRLDDEEKQKLILQSETFANYHLYINETPCLSVEEFKTLCINQIKEKNIQVIMIDNLQALHSETCKYTERSSELEYITKELRRTAQEQQICLIATSQLNRNVEHRRGLYNKKPVLSDLKDCGSIEEEADKIIFIHRPEYYGFVKDECGNSLENVVELLISKNRNGETNEVRFLKTKDFTNFVEPETLSLNFDNKQNE